VTKEEKLKHFYDSAIESVTIQSQQMLNEYSSALDKQFSEHKEDMLRKSELEIAIEKDRLERKINKEISLEEIKSRRIISGISEELKQKLLIEIKDKFEIYTTTPEYRKKLAEQIKEAKAIAKDNEIIVYIDPVDLTHKISLERETGIVLLVAEETFMGGIKAYIPDKNLLIDSSFKNKLEEIAHDVALKGGILNG
jgi:Archaeal/vacuolar-type H+-ATPase subunit E